MTDVLQVIHAGGSSNRTIDHIVKESTLIELYRECHMTIENSFHLEHRTIRHAPPNMVNTLRKLSETFKRTTPHKYSLSRTALHCTPDQIAVAMHLLLIRKEVPSVVDGEDSAEVNADDLEAE